MNYKGFPIGVHLNENSVKVLEGIVQHDNGNLFQIQLYDGTDAFDFTGYDLLNVVLIRPDETTLADIWPVTEIDEETGEETETGATESHTFLAIQYLDPKNGRITLRVGGEATAQVGLHRMAIEIYSDGALLTTARVNYNVTRSLNSVSQSILQESEDYVALQELLATCSSLIEAEQERSNQEAIRQSQEDVRQSNVAGLIADLTAYMSTLTENIEKAQEAARTAIRYSELARAVSIDDFPADLKSAIENANESIEGLADVQARVGALETKTTRLNLDDSDGYLYLPVVTNSTIETYFSGNTFAGAVALNTSDGALYVGTGAGAYKVVKDPAAFPGYAAVSSEPADTDCLWIDTANGNQMKYYNGVDWITVKSIAVFG